jgi:hypothetical protein
MKVELTKFRVKPGKSTRIDEWIDYMHRNMDDVLLNLKDENMYVETIFREEFYGVEYLYWYSVQSDKRHEQKEDPYIDPKHIEYMEECIDKTYRPQDMLAEVIMIQKDVSKIMN